MLYDFIRPTLFRLTADDPERAHEWVMHLLASTSRPPTMLAGCLIGTSVRSSRLRQQVLGLTFPNPVGVAAGFDKNAVALPMLAGLGFGFIEAGTVTYHPQPGNQRPRVVRLPAHSALVNRMGFNNDGAVTIARRLSRSGSVPVPVGLSLGKSRITDISDAVGDYRASFRELAPYADYIAVNVSSPNTPGLRVLQERGQIEALLTALQQEGESLAGRIGRRVPILVKIAPDLSDEALRELLEVCLTRGVDGVIAVNTTIGRPGGVSESSGAASDGGLSGRPLFPRALEVVRTISACTEGQMPIIGVGGIFNAADAYAMIRAGASLVQVYTGLIYVGPMIARRINRGLLRLMDRDGVRSLAEVRGVM